MPVDEEQQGAQLGSQEEMAAMHCQWEHVLQLILLHLEMKCDGV